jgi:hypothetical protein
MFSDKASKIKIENHGIACALWFVGWLFTIGFLELTFFRYVPIANSQTLVNRDYSRTLWKGVLAILVWPYYLGEFFKPIEKIAAQL